MSRPEPATAAAPVALQYLAFELSLGDEGQVTLDAQASLRASDGAGIAAATAEAEAVLAWATRSGWGDPGPLEDGHAWDAALHQHAEPGGWHTVALTLSGPAALADALGSAFPGSLQGADGAA